MSDKSEAGTANGGLQAKIRQLVEYPTFERAILAVIFLNALSLGLETSATAMAVAGPLIQAFDQAALMIYVVEIGLKLFAYRSGFFRNGWNLFDLAIVLIALLPSEGGLAVLRALRILRALRLISGVSSMRKVVHGLLQAIPGMGSIIALLGLVFYISAVIATKLFATSFPPMVRRPG